MKFPLLQPLLAPDPSLIHTYTHPIVDMVVPLINGRPQQLFQFQLSVNFLQGVELGDLDLEVLLVGLVGEGLLLEALDLVQHAFQDALNLVLLGCGVQDQRVLSMSKIRS